MSWRQRNKKVLARQHEECRYRFRWRGLIVGTTGVYPRFLLIAFDLQNDKVRCLCYDKCHDIADHFSYAGVRRLLKAGAKPLEIPDEPIQFYVQIFPCLLSRSGCCTNPFCCRSGSWKAISFRSGSTLFSILRSKAKVRACCNLYLLLSLSHHGRSV
ncbi:hypothetical protein YC2023_075546 [Brassica napus]